MIGTIVTLNVDRGFGFIQPESGSGRNNKDVFFHCKALEGLEFDEQLRQRRVEFAVEQDEKGPRARNVRPV